MPSRMPRGTNTPTTVRVPWGPAGPVARCHSPAMVSWVSGPGSRGSSLGGVSPGATAAWGASPGRTRPTRSKPSSSRCASRAPGASGARWAAAAFRRRSSWVR